MIIVSLRPLDQSPNKNLQYIISTKFCIEISSLNNGVIFS